MKIRYTIKAVIELDPLVVANIIRDKRKPLTKDLVEDHILFELDSPPGTIDTDPDDHDFREFHNRVCQILGI